MLVFVFLNFQKETLNILNSNGFSKYKVEFEKKLV